MKNIYVLGSINVDLVTVVKEIPQQGETKYGESFSIFNGGKGSNQAVAASKLSKNVRFCGSVGNDLFGVDVKKNLEDCGVDTSNIETINHQSTGTATILVTHHDNRIIINPGANHDISEIQVSNFINQAKKSDILITQGEIPLSINHLAMKLANDKGMIVIHNCAPSNIGILDSLHYIDYLIVNETELFDLTKIQKEHLAIQKLIQMGCKNVILTKGAKGFYWQNNLGKIYHKEALKVEVVDTTGAGDAFCGAFASFLSQGYVIEKSLTFASYVGSMAVLSLGAQSSYPSLDELNKFINQNT